MNEGTTEDAATTPVKTTQSQYAGAKPTPLPSPPSPIPKPTTKLRDPVVGSQHRS